MPELADRIGVGIVGVGVAARVIHIPALVGHRQLVLKAICDSNPRRLTVLPQMDVARHAELPGLLADPAVEAIIVCTPPDSHLAIGKQAIAAGRHVLMEKPLARTMRECAELTEAAEAQGVQLRLAHERRFQRTCQRIRETVRSGAIGAPFLCGVHWGMCVKLDPDRLAPAEDAEGGFRDGYRWRWSNPNIGGGVLQDHIPHYVDLVRDWTGQEPISVYATTKNVARDCMEWSPESSRWEDLGIVLVDFSGGLTLRLELSLVGRSLSPLWHTGTGVGEWTEYGYIFGTEGQLVFDFLMMQASENGRASIWRKSEAGPKGYGWTALEQADPDRAAGMAPGGAARDMFVAQLDEFAKAIRGLPNTSPSALDGAITIAVTEAAYRSAESGARYQVASV